MAPIAQFSVDTQRTIALLAIFEGRLDPLDQGFVPGRSFRRRALPGMEAAQADARDTAEEPDRMAGAVSSDECETRNHVFAAH